MKHVLPLLDALKLFECAARHLSFSQAAQELCITKGAVSYQIRKLEAELDCALFQRSIRQVYLTNAGRQLMQTVRRLFAELEQTLAQLRPGDARHDVSIGATTYVALRWLSPRCYADLPAGGRWTGLDRACVRGNAERPDGIPLLRAGNEAKGVYKFLRRGTGVSFSSISL